MTISAHAMITVIIQARTGSTRLPKKVLLAVKGKTLLEHLILRVKQSSKVGAICVATTQRPSDAAIVRVAKKCGIAFFRGSELDVLDRFYHAAKEMRGNTLVRITADCPLLDPKIMDATIALFEKGGYDYVSNTLPPTFPDGMDVEVFSFAALERAWKEAREIPEREHVTSYIRNNQRLFRIGNLLRGSDLSKLRLTVDYKKDWERIRRIIEELYPKNPRFTLSDVLGYLRYAEVIAVLGGGLVRENGEWRTTTFAEKDSFGVLGDRLRVLAAARLAREGAGAVIALGGKGQLAGVRGAVAVGKVVARELREEGVAPERIIALPKGASTKEQLRCLKTFATIHRIARVTIISNRYHVPRIRAMLRFLPELAGWKGVETVSAEDLLLRFEPVTYRNRIAAAYRSEAMRDRLKKERAGVRALRLGNYTTHEKGS